MTTILSRPQYKQLYVRNPFEQNKHALGNSLFEQLIGPQDCIRYIERMFCGQGKCSQN